MKTEDVVSSTSLYKIWTFRYHHLLWKTQHYMYLIKLKWTLC